MNESEIFQAAIKLRPDLRREFIESACAGNQQLQSEIEALLREFDEMGSFIDRPAVRELPTDVYQPIAESPGTTIGPYKLMEQIGEGGFGLVFVAEQQQPVRRKVALKIIKPGMDTREVIARFEAERQALALMDHPNIARVFDAGTTESGRPYFVMELVKGIPITEYCDQQHLTARQRLELFVSVCQAVQHAHTKGIIHRDIKPSNILVAPHDGVPVIKVIDFGVAKAIGQQLTDKTIYTRFTQMIGTPLYMSPEQAEINALDVDTRSDVYSLGVLLYELLTGTTPIDRQRLAKAAYDEIRRIIKEEEPPKPSTRLSTMGESLSQVSNCRNVEPSKLSALVKGDLDWIVMKALEKDRSRRYETAISFAADVRRFLAEEAIEARPPSTWYRFQKAARRNRIAIGTATLLTLTMLLGLAGTSWQAYRASQNETVALENEKRAIEERDAKERALEKEAQQRAIAEGAQAKAQEERDAAKLAREELRKSLYAASMSLIPAAWEADNVNRVHELLGEQIPNPGEEDLRHFEWYYWYRQSHGATRSWKLGAGPEMFLLSEDGSRIVGWSSSDPFPIENGVGSSATTIRVLDAVTERELLTHRIHAQDIFSQDLVQETSRLGVSQVVINQNASRIAFVLGLFTPADSPGGSPTAGMNARPRVTLNYKTVVFDLQTQKAIFDKDLDASRIAISPDGKRLFTTAAGPRDATLEARKTKFKIWDIDLPNKEPVGLVASDQAEQDLPTIEPRFSPDGLRLVMVARAGRSMQSPTSLQIWDTVSGKQQLNHSLGDPKSSESAGAIMETAFSPDGKVLATIGHRVPSDFVTGINVIRDARVCLWDCTNPTKIQALHGDGGISLVSKMPLRKCGIQFSGDGERLIAWNEDENIGSLIGVSSRSVVQKIKTQSNIRNIAFSTDCKQMIAVAGDNARAGNTTRTTNAIVEVWNVAAPIQSKSVPTRRPTNEVVIWSPNKLRQASFTSGIGRGLFQSEEDNFNVTITDADGTEVLRFKEHAFPVCVLRFSPDGQSVLSSSVGSLNEIETLLWETDTGKVRWSFKTGPQQMQQPVSRLKAVSMDVINSLSSEFSPDGKWIAVPTEHGQKIVHFSDLKDHFVVDSKHRTYFSPDSLRMVSFQPSAEGQRNSWPGQVQEFAMKIWDVKSGLCLATQRLSYPEATAIPTRIASTYHVIFSPDSRLFTPIGSFPMTIPNHVDIYSLENGEQLVRIPIRQESDANSISRFGSTRSVIFSPKGDQLVNLDGTIQGMAGTRQSVGVWHLPTAKLLYRIDGNAFAIQAAAFSPDGKRLATASTHPDKSEVKLWDVASGREMLTLSTQERFRASSISFSPDNQRLTLQDLLFASADNSGPPREIVWNVTPKGQPN